MDTRVNSRPTRLFQYQVIHMGDVAKETGDIILHISNKVQLLFELITPTRCN